MWGLHQMFFSPLCPSTAVYNRNKSWHNGIKHFSPKDIMSCIWQPRKWFHLIVLYLLRQTPLKLCFSFLLSFISSIMSPKNVFNRHVAVNRQFFSCQGGCLFSQVSEKHKHRGLSAGVVIFMPGLQSFEKLHQPCVVLLPDKVFPFIRQGFTPFHVIEAL